MRVAQCRAPACVVRMVMRCVICHTAPAAARICPGSATSASITRRHLRRAAVLAGLVPEAMASSDGLLTLLYEPEAAALTTCQQSNLTVELGQKFLILDAGGCQGEALAARGLPGQP
jgi:hypothetical protein